MSSVKEMSLNAISGSVCVETTRGGICSERSIFPAGSNSKVPLGEAS